MTDGFNKYDAEGLLAVIKDKLLFINNCIFELNKYSFDDFKALSNIFKKCYEDINAIYNNTNSAFKVALSTHKEEITEEVSAIARLSNEVIEELQDVIKHYMQEQAASNQHKNLLFLSLNNFRQDVKTLELLMANIKLGEDFVHQGAAGDTVSSAELKSRFRGFSDLINDNITLLKQNDESLNAVYFDEDTDNLSKLDTPFFDNHTIGSIHHQHFTLIERGNAKLEKSVDAATRSFSSIVTKLQYQDIISQSIQHMLSAHKNIIEQTESGNNNDETDVNALLKKVKFMTLLQTGQLIQVNKDYQESIKVIVDKFDELSSNVQALVELSDSLKSKSIVTESFWADMLPHLQLLENTIDMADKVMGVMSEARILALSDDTIYKDVDKAICLFEAFISSFADALLKNKSTKDFGMLINLIQTINNDAFQVHTLLDALSSHSHEMIMNILSQAKLSEIQQTFSLSREKMQELREHIEEINAKLKLEIKENIHLGADISHNLKNSIHEIHYYTHFERTAELIITELEEIKENILIDEMDLAEINTEEFKHLYTVKSEHLVLNTLVNTAPHTEEQAAKQEDDIEFF